MMHTCAIIRAIRPKIDRFEKQYTKNASMERSLACFLERYRNELFTDNTRSTDLAKKLRRKVSFEEWRENWLQEMYQKRDKRSKTKSLDSDDSSCRKDEDSEMQDKEMHEEMDVQGRCLVTPNKSTGK